MNVSFNSSSNGIIGESLFGLKVAGNLFVLFLCFSSNLLVVYTLIHERLVRKPFEYVLLHMAFTDMGAVLSMVTVNLTYLVNNSTWPLGVTMCKILRPLYIYFLLLGCLHILLISYVRYKAVVFPLKSQVTKTTLRKVIGFSYFLYLSLYIYYAPYLKIKDGVCESVYPQSHNIALFHYFIVSYTAIIPIILLAFTNGSIIIVLWRRKRQIQVDLVREKLRSKQNIRVLKMTIAIVALYIMAYSIAPLSRTLMEGLGKRAQEKAQRGWYRNYYSWISCFSLLLSNCSAPFIYGIFNRKVSRGYKKAIKVFLRL